MSWSAPSPGAPPSYSQQASYAHQPYPPYPPSNGAPAPPNASVPYPPKRKGNPVITRYPLPPGYRPPQAPPGAPPYGSAPYPPQGYQAPVQGYPPQPNYPSGPPANYQQSYPGYPPNYQQPTPGYQPGYQWPAPPQGYQTPAQGYAAHSYPQGYQQPGASDPAAPLASYPPGGWQQPPPPPATSPRGSQASPTDQNATPTSAHIQPGTANSSPTSSHRPPKSKRGPSSRTVSISADEIPETHKLYQTEPYVINLGLDEWDQTDFDGAIWPKANDPVDTDLSLGVINWHPAEQITRALPWDFHEAEERAKHPPPPALGNGESVSIYFTPENAHEAFLNVRQTDEWENMKHDSIFHEFTEPSATIPLEEVINNRDRVQEEEEIPHESDWNVMDNLDQALSNEQDASGSKTTTGSGPSPPPFQPPPRDEAQEDILASLGVTGSPKPIQPLSGPQPMLPPKPERSGSMERSSLHSRPPPHLPFHNGYHHSGLPPHMGSSHSPPIPPPPPQRERSPSYDPWKVDQLPSTNSRTRSPAISDSSQHTAAGSDFHMDDNDPFNANAPPPQLHRNESSAGRKRSYEEAESGEEKHRQEDDYTPRIKRRQPRVAAAYGRR
ncbi:uncharacterized protein K452DRAFT_161971 [Aplosporella prunicola CBS 121167]|uniref:Uncharacterized protein n=1 Tax=Aplosporella prunicola CBS 121167 TaxID=1176127 RepID=A0A6A6BHZ5_9PEZI|nr:uncharacterized protein K452DRAFT_161971 [Aplosporella prunicola CBS 121167]KAF2143769.1 hypothetical protein K452DRAFT_161971 [Aplosporella prunicola CBS 121167]